ncbi:MAG TPA: hypothetical protein VFQ35_19250 [Polyangiaceae bacterium]|nr:hypothetical protein [Polyangiaceae bacterium]
MGLSRCLFGASVSLALLFGACSEPSLRVGYDDLSAGGISTVGGSAGSANSGSGGVAGAPACKVTRCESNKAPYQCGDCMDNDGDGLVDAEDPECTGPCDNDEKYFSSGLPQQSGGNCRRDCYFDRDAGSGNDRCDWSYTCDKLSIAPAFPPTGESSCAYQESASCADLRQTQDAMCLEVCLPITPNGCDCFGCCELPARSNNFVWLGSTRNGSPSCDLAHANDQTACAPCTPVDSCFNHCDDCEVCAGATTVGPGCTGSTPLCSFGTPCGPRAACPGTTYCISGCCVEVPL